MPTKSSRALKEARRDLAFAEDMNRNAASTLAQTRAERDKAREERDIAVKVGVDMSAEISRQRQHVRRLFNSIFHLNLDLARKVGYIDRVKETDSDIRTSVEPIMATDFPDIDRERDALAGARSEKMVASVIDGMDSDVLDQVLGRDPDADYDRG